ncbi:MAG TPA: hypothetical protein VLT92_09805 [Burkholderiales bacterium]|nr:hypothetical protein [Burkholderiales bacterium]
MGNLTTQQIAELLIGIARAQQAVVDAVESAKPGFRMTHLSPVLQSAAKLRNTNHVATLTDLPARVLLQCQGRAGPDVAQIARDLDEMLAAQRPAAGSGADSLDMTRS